MDRTEREITRGLELLQLCQQLQSEKDGIDRTRIADEFVRDVTQVSMLLVSLRTLLPVLVRLADIGRKLEKSGLIEIDHGEEYTGKVLSYFETMIQVKFSADSPALARAVMDWWKEAQFMTNGEHGERNVFDADPEFVAMARKLIENVPQKD